MKIDLTFSVNNIDELQLRDKNVVVIDVLRASTTVIAALHNGAREIIPVSNIESAVKISGSLFGDVTLRGGERGGKMIQGFNLGNSPLEYTEASIKGKSIIYSTTNGSIAMWKSRFARNMVVGAFVNLSKVTEFLSKTNEDALVMCAGDSSEPNGFSLEDAVCGGMVVQQLSQMKNMELELSDSARAAHTLYKSFGRSIQKMLKDSAHGKYLAGIGYKEDIQYSAQVDSLPVLPILSGSALKLKKDEKRAAEPEITPAVK
ncbi:MAG: 2-phosphosulfolactate phosphatase [Ignavibacteriae bacterium]|nr:2-phosphosulfolactate phosphatase [Ignavibacteriota bacterium]